jgi:uncharacterized protein (TIGR01244 family)
MRTLRLIPVLMLLAIAGGTGAGEATADALSQLPLHVAVDSRFHVSAQPTAEALVNLPAAGVRTVINLRPASETPDLDEKSLVEKAGMKYHSLPIAGVAGLTRDNVATFDRLLAESQEGKVLLHCASGNRVGAMMALRARWVQGKSAEEALAIGKGAGLKGLEADVKTLLQAEAPAADVVSAPSPYRQQN